MDVGLFDSPVFYLDVRLSKCLVFYLDVGLERGKMTGGEGQFSAIVVRTSSVKRPPQPDKPRQTGNK